MRDCPDSSQYPAIIVQPVTPRFDSLINANLDDTHHRTECSLPPYIAPATLRKLTSILDGWLAAQGVRDSRPPMERVVR